MRGMLVLSGLFHLVLGFVGLVVSAQHAGTPRLEPVAVVNLVGGGEYRRAAEKPAPPAGPPAKEAAVPLPPSRKEPAPAKKEAAASRAKEEPAKRKEAAASPDDYSTSGKKAERDISSVERRLREMREARAGSESVRRAVEERRSEAAARAAVRGVHERVARRIESPAGAGGGGAGGFGGGSQGTVRVSPEMLEFFRKLEEKVRESWVVPGAVARSAGTLMVEVRIVIESDGRVSDSRIEKGSGNVYFDESVRRAIRKASPLPVPPERLRGGEDHYEVGFRFHGTGGEG